MRTRESSEPEKLAEIVREGLAAGLIGAITVMAVYFVIDVSSGQPFRTPALLQSVLFEGQHVPLDSRPDGIQWVGYTALHVAAWLIAGVFAAFVTRTYAYPRIWLMTVAGLALAFLGFIWATGVWRIEGFNSAHLWIGALVGCLFMGGFLAWHHDRERGE